LDQVLAHIEAPHLNDVSIAFMDPPILAISRLSPCIGPTETIKAFDQAWIQFWGSSFKVALSSRNGTISRKEITLSLRWMDSAWKVETLAYPVLLHPPILYLDQDIKSETKNVGITSWLDLLHVFTTVKRLNLSMGLALCIGPALQELVGERATEVLPVLQTIVIAKRKTFEAEVIREVMGKFVAAREASGHPVTVKVGLW
jgi:hypothetical protein